MYIIADSGSTKVDWRAINEYGSVKGVTTQGINPVFMSQEEITGSFSEKLSVFKSQDVKAIYFYGAGIVSEELKEKISGSLKAIFPDAHCEVASDMLGAARGLCGNDAGIACIIGTGSNSCFYDGKKIESNVPAGGFILGDEASGAYFGKRLLSDYIKGLIPTAVVQEFDRRFDLDYAKIVENVYKCPKPNAYLASFAPFLHEFRNHPYVSGLVKSGFEDFLGRNVSQYDFKTYPVNFTGSIAFYFKDILEKCVVAAGMKPGGIVRKPMDGLIAYHKEK